MAQNIHLKDRVRFNPGLKRSELPPMFDCKYVGTVYLSAGDQAWLPTDFSGWQGDSRFNYSTIVGERLNDGSGAGIVSDIDYNIFARGLQQDIIGVINPAVNNEYELFYGNAVKPNGEHSGYMYYTIYDLKVTNDNSGKGYYSFALDIWESNVILNNETDYNEIN